ncbi:hypothetical protein Btru_016028 [Bulinus truncatus]|nr:hypothetical protein Btru_016028 [Bulinus truncatus]
MARLKYRHAVYYIVSVLYCIVLLKTFRVLHSRDEDKVIETKSLELDMFRRIHLMRTSCDERWSRDLRDKFNTPAFLWDQPKRLLYCQTQKTGCTFWRRVFTYLTLPDQMTQLNIKSPLDIDRKTVHDGPLFPKYGSSAWRVVKSEIAPQTLKFVFTRNPYKRLWSVYLDKYFLPDFWKLREMSTSVCLGNLSFNDFIAFAMTSRDGHMSPISEICNPCEFRPDVIGTMETFSRDVKFILKRTKYDYLPVDLNFTEHMKSEIVSVVTSTYKVYSRHKMFTCMTDKELAIRFWRVFQLNGYLNKNLEFTTNLTTYSQETLLQHLIQIVNTQIWTPEESRRQKTNFIVQAYKSVSRNNILEIQKRFQSDFEIFGYDINPPS